MLAHHHGSLWWDIVFHGTGAALAVIGWLMLPVRPFDADTEPQAPVDAFARSSPPALGRVP
jgi:hypothetical protein